MILYESSFYKYLRTVYMSFLNKNNNQNSIHCVEPNQGMFEELLRRINQPSINVTHIAQSFYHDMRTAKELGFGKRIWINRYNRKGDPEYKPDAELSNLTNVREFLAL